METQTSDKQFVNGYMRSRNVKPKKSTEPSNSDGAIPVFVLVCAAMLLIATVYWYIVLPVVTVGVGIKSALTYLRKPRLSVNF